MRTNKQSKIKVKNSGYSRSRFNWSHDVNTTYSWGEIQPTQCKLLIPNSKTTLKTQDLIRLAPMVAPTFGRVKYKTYSQFVPISELFPQFDSMMAQQPNSSAAYTKVQSSLPYISLGKLSSYVLYGARATLYWVSEDYAGQPATNAQKRYFAKQGSYRTVFKTASGTVPTEGSTMLGYLSSAFTAVSGTFLSDYCPEVGNIGNRVAFAPKLFTSSADSVFANDLANHESAIVLGNTTLNSLLPYTRTATLSGFGALSTSIEVTSDSCDYAIEFCVTDSSNREHYYCLFLELSDFGKRLRKIIQGCGYQIDFSSTQAVSILPLLAQYKAYFDVFGLQLYQGWETTKCAKLIKIIENGFLDSLESSMAVLPCGTASTLTLNQKIFGHFVLHELGNEFYTEDADFIGANISSLSVSPEVKTNKFITVDSNGVKAASVTSYTDHFTDDGANTTQQDYPGSTLSTSATVNGAQGWINQIQHGQVDAELLKRMYRWVNRNTILGREIEKILRAQGLGDYVDKCESYFIGSTDTLVTISDVVSQAATADAALGEYGGRGLEYDESHIMEYTNKDYGYWITLSTIVPESGYTQGLDPTLTALDKFGLYNPDFDALGMEATQKNTVVASRYIVGFDPNTADNPNQTFGFVPMMSKFKVCQNLVNGDFNRHNKRNTYSPYTLDKMLNINDYETVNNMWTAASGSDPEENYVELAKSGTLGSMPVAGNIWRTPTKYKWLGNFDRIFLQTDSLTNYEKYLGMTGDVGNVAGFVSYTEDNFLAHSIYDLQCYAPMKPIEESYGLEDSDVGVSGVAFVNKN